MTERGDNPFERAEGFFKKVLERIGSSVDEKIAPGDVRLPSHIVGTLAADIEDAIEADLEADSRGVRRIAPDRYEVFLTYEHNASLSDLDRQALARELAASTYEYVTNHRYETRARIYVEVGCDIFARTARIETSFSAPAGETAEGIVREVHPVSAGSVKQPKAAASTYQFVGSSGKPVVRVELQPGGDPVTIGRAAGNRLLVDHESVSKFHATVTLTGDNRLVLADLGSTNGTFLGGDANPISRPVVVTPGSTIVFGDVAFRLEKVD